MAWLAAFVEFSGMIFVFVEECVVRVVVCMLVVSSWVGCGSLWPELLADLLLVALPAIVLLLLVVLLLWQRLLKLLLLVIWSSPLLLSLMVLCRMACGSSGWLCHASPC